MKILPVHHLLTSAQLNFSASLLLFTPSIDRGGLIFFIQTLSIMAGNLLGFAFAIPHELGWAEQTHIACAIGTTFTSQLAKPERDTGRGK